MGQRHRRMIYFKKPAFILCTFLSIHLYLLNMANNFVENLCPIYQNLLGKLFTLTEYAETREEEEEIVEKFCEKNFLLSQFWKKHTVKYNREEHIKLPEKRDTKSIFLYYFLKSLKTKGKIMAKNVEWSSDALDMIQTLKDYEEAINLIEDAFFFPHKRMEKYYYRYANFSAQPMTAKMEKSYAKNISLFKEFKKAGENDKEWLQCLKKLENEEAVIANIELRLGNKKSCTNKEIWKYYIEYLRDRDYTAMLEVYLRYCRFFISDNEMLKEYRKGIKNIGNLHKKDVSVFWFDTIEWELDFGELETAEKLLKDCFESVGRKLVIPNLTSKTAFVKVLNKCKEKMKECVIIQSQNQSSEKYEDRENGQELAVRPTKRNQSCLNSFEDKDVETPAKRRRMQKLPCYYKKLNFYQSFSIPTTMAKYIANNTNSTLLSKLHQSSKYFFSILPYPVCYRLVKKKSAEQKYFQQSLFISHPNLKFLENQKLYLSNSLAYCSHDGQNTLSSFISKLYKCDAINIFICNETLTLKDLEFLVSSGKVKNFHCLSLTVKDKNDEFLSRREILRFIESYGNKLEDYFISDPSDFLYTRCTI